MSARFLLQLNVAASFCACLKRASASRRLSIGQQLTLGQDGAIIHVDALFLQLGAALQLALA